MSLRSFLGNRRMLMLVVGTAGAWFLFEYAYYGNTLSLPSILKEVAPHSSLGIQVVVDPRHIRRFALPGYLVAIAKMDRIGHRRLQFIGFGVMALCFLVLGAFPTTTVVPFLAIFGLSYFFIEFGPNMTTFVMPSEVFPVSMRTTGHGLAAGIGKLGAFVGVLLVPRNCRSTSTCEGCSSLRGPRPSWGSSSRWCCPNPPAGLEEVSGEDADIVDVATVAIPALKTTSSPRIVRSRISWPPGTRWRYPKTDELDQPPRTRHQEDAHLHRRKAQTYRWVLPWLSPRFRPLARRRKTPTPPRRRARGTRPARSKFSSVEPTGFSKTIASSGSRSRSCRSSATIRQAARPRSSPITDCSPCFRPDAVHDHPRLPRA